MDRAAPTQSLPSRHADISIVSGNLDLHGVLDIPDRANGLVLFAHGSGSSRHSPRNRHVAHLLQEAGVATLLFDLLTPQEEHSDELTAHLRFDIALLASRLRLATYWSLNDRRTATLQTGYFGASTGAAAALVAAADPALDIAAIVSRGGRPDLAGAALPLVRAATLLIVGGADHAVIPLNRWAFERLVGVKKLEIVPHATHLFTEPGALDTVAQLAARWFKKHLAHPSRS